MDDIAFPTCWTSLSRREFRDIVDRSAGISDVVIRSDMISLISFSKNLMNIIDKLEKVIEDYDRSEVAKF